MCMKQLLSLVTEPIRNDTTESIFVLHNTIILIVCLSLSQISSAIALKKYFSLDFNTRNPAFWSEFIAFLSLDVTFSFAFCDTILPIAEEVTQRPKDISNHKLRNAQKMNSNKLKSGTGFALV